jgi:peptidoglycan/LPS O-acetylase OafA/YrhL
MPRPTHNAGSYLPALDGLRALAVIFVIAYHLGIPGFTGGLLGVGVFFTLSGFLITSLLLGSRERTGGFELQTFWLRRARRLLPAMALVLVTTLLAAAVATPDNLGQYTRQALSALFYVNNWYTISSSHSYFDHFAGPGPLGHLWSLSIEEQFYLIWPVLLVLMYRLLKRRGAVALATVALAVGSFYLLHALAHPGLDTTRAYEGTDTRAGGLLLGAALAFYWPARKHTVGEQTRTWIDVLGIAGVVLMVRLVTQTADGSMSLYSSGILLVTLATAAVLVAAVTTQTLVASLLGQAPLRWIGERSYGIYLWHMPVVAFLPAAVRNGSHLFSSILVIAATVALASLSWTVIEDPIRRYGFRAALTTARPLEDSVFHRTTRFLISRLDAGSAMLSRLQQRGTVPQPDGAGSPAAGPVPPTAQLPILAPLAALVGVVPMVPPADRDHPVPADPAPVDPAPADSETADSEAAPDVIADVDPVPAPRPVPICRTMAVVAAATSGTDEPEQTSAEETSTEETSADETHNNTDQPPVLTEPHVEAQTQADDTATVVLSTPSTEAAETGEPAPSTAGRPGMRAAATVAGVLAVATGVLIATSAVSPHDGLVRAMADAPDAAVGPLTTAEVANSNTPAGPTLPPEQRRTRCTTVIHIGDSTSIGMNSADDLPDPATRMVGRYKEYGATNVISDISGGRSSLERLNGQPNATEAIQAHMAAGDRGCWVVAMGLNDAANIAAGGVGPIDMRIDRMLKPIGDQPVLWPTVLTSSAAPQYYENSGMVAFDRALIRACSRYPNLRVYDWAAEVNPAWFKDGVHYIPAGNAERARRFAVALATEFPKSDLAPRGCVLESTSAVEHTTHNSRG